MLQQARLNQCIDLILGRKVILSLYYSFRGGVNYLVESRLKPLIKIARIEDQLPGFNCGNCDYKTCYELARAIAENKAKLADCNIPESARHTLIIKANNRVLPINPFVQKIIRKAVLAMISTLKGTTIKGNEAVLISVKETSASNSIRVDRG